METSFGRPDRKECGRRVDAARVACVEPSAHLLILVGGHVAGDDDFGAITGRDDGDAAAGRRPLFDGDVDALDRRGVIAVDNDDATGTDLTRQLVAQSDDFGA